MLLEDLEAVCASVSGLADDAQSNADLLPDDAGRDDGRDAGREADKAVAAVAEGSRPKVGVLGDTARKELLLLGRGYLPATLDSDEVGESRSKKLVMQGDEGLTPEAAYESIPRSPWPSPEERRLEASRKEAFRGGACGPPSPTGRRSDMAGTPDLQLRRDERAEMTLFLE